MGDGAPPAKRPKYDLTETFDVVVGKEPSSQIFTVYSNVLNSRSEFFKAARRPEWLADPNIPVDLQNEEPEVFSRYLNCAYFGIETLQIDADAPEDDRDDMIAIELGPDAFICSEAEHATLHEEEYRSRGNYEKYVDQCLRIFTDLYLLADRLRDMQTANLVMDELVRFSDNGGRPFDEDTVRRVYDSTAHGNPLRKLMRDERVYETNSSLYMSVHVEPGHPEFIRDVMVEFLRLRDVNFGKKVKDVYSLHDKHGSSIDKCHYHQHGETHPRCMPDPGEERDSRETSTERKHG